MRSELNANPEALRDADAVMDLFKRAEGGDRTALEALRVIGDTWLPEIWAVYGDLGREVERRLIALIAGENALFRESVAQRMDALRAALEGASPTPLERLLVERVIVSTLQASFEDCLDTEYRKNPGSLAHSLYLQKRAETAQRRLLAASRSLVALRRYTRPSSSR